MTKMFEGVIHIQWENPVRTQAGAVAEVSVVISKSEAVRWIAVKPH